MTLWKALKYHDKIRRPCFLVNAYLTFDENDYLMVMFEGVLDDITLHREDIFATDWEPYVDHKTAPEDQKP